MEDLYQYLKGNDKRKQIKRISEFFEDKIKNILGGKKSIIISQGKTVQHPISDKSKHFSIPNNSNRHAITMGNFICGVDQWGRPLPSPTLRNVEGMRDYVLRIDFPDDENCWTKHIIDKLKALGIVAQREDLKNRIKLRSQVFQELRNLGISVPAFKSKIILQGDRLSCFTLVKKIEGATVLLHEFSDEMIPAIIDAYSKLGDYFLEKCKNLEWKVLLCDIKAHQFMYGKIGEEPNKLYYVDVGMESVFFVEDIPPEGDHKIEYRKTNTAHYKVLDLIKSVEHLEKVGKLGNDSFVELKMKLEKIYEETGEIMMQYTRVFK